MAYSLWQKPFPSSVSIGDTDYTVASDFRSILAICAILDDPLFQEQEKLEAALSIFYCHHIPADKAAAFQAFSAFLRCYQEEESDNTTEKVFDYQQDAYRIYAAFQQLYQIDLMQENLHWFRFRILLENINDGTCDFLKAIQYRSMKITTDMNPQQRLFYQSMKQKYALHEVRPVKEIQSDLADLFQKGMMGWMDRNSSPEASGELREGDIRMVVE